MNARERLLAQMRALCAEPCPEDGVRPKRESRATNHHTQDLRLAGRVARSVALALGASGDPLLNPLLVLHGRPDPDASRVVLQLLLPGEADVVLLDATHARLVAASGEIRAAVAADLQRRQTPRLRFVVVGERP